MHSQVLSLPPLLRGRDVIIHGMTGSSAINALVIAALHRVDTSIPGCQVLILMPTRDRAIATKHKLARVGEFLPVRHHAVVGGLPVRDDITVLASGIHVVVGTPGRLSDLTQRNYLRLGALRLVALESVDEMLDRGFAEQIGDIMNELPARVQVALVSSTSPREFVEMAAKFTRDPAVVCGELRCDPTAHLPLSECCLSVSRAVRRSWDSLSCIRQFRVVVDCPAQKPGALVDIMLGLTIQAVIYCNTARKVEDLARFLTDAGHSVSAIVDRTGAAVDTDLSRFTAGASRILISTAPTPQIHRRGVVVIMCDLPTDFDDIPERVGYDGRSGVATAIYLVTRAECAHLADVQAHFQPTTPGESLCKSSRFTVTRVCERNRVSVSPPASQSNKTAYSCSPRYLRGRRL